MQWQGSVSDYGGDIGGVNNPTSNTLNGGIIAAIVIVCLIVVGYYYEP